MLCVCSVSEEGVHEKNWKVIFWESVVKTVDFGNRVDEENLSLPSMNKYHWLDAI